tara:strand:- start:199 stop:426 length:228 start_codon:yes stop_codon:yes gene_type:complete
MVVEDSVLNQLNNIVDIITPILSDIKTNVSNTGNIPTDENKVILKEIAKKLRALKKDIISLYNKDSTIQTTLNND